MKEGHGANTGAPSSPVIQVLPKRSNIPSLVCAFSASVTTGGTIYCFGVLSNDLKQALHISQMQLESVSAAFFIAGLLSWIPGLIVDRQKMRFSMALGGISGAAVTALYWFLCRHPNVWPFFAQHPVPVLSGLAVAISLSCGLIVGSIFKLTMLCGGPDGKGPSVGIAKGFVGLGSGVYATLFQAIRKNHESTLDFLLVIAFFFLLCATLPALVLLPPKEWSVGPGVYQFETTVTHFRTMYGSLAVLCAVIVVNAIHTIWNTAESSSSSSMTGNRANLPTDNQRQYGKVLLILILWLGPIVSLLFLPRKAKETEDEEVFSETSRLVTKKEQQEEDVEHNNNKDSVQTLLPPIKLRHDLTLPEMLRTWSAWIMLFITLILVGSGTAKTNNMGQMVQSLGFSEVVTPATLAIFSVAQASARIVTGIVSEAALDWKSGCVPWFFQSERGTPRPFFLFVASCVALLAHLILALSTSLTAFVMGCAVAAVAFGMAWPLMVLIVGDIFGVEHHGANYMFFDGGTKALGTLLLSKYVAGSVYEAHTMTTHDDSFGTNHTCWGADCFEETHWIIAGFALLCILASLVLCYQTRHVYQSKY